jgi:hypothetical protein
MPSASAKQNFAAYLISPIERYPITEIPLSITPVRDHRKELIFQQSLFLKIAEEYLPVKPWITYFATIKHFRLISAQDVSTATFNDLRDKEFAVQVEAIAESLRESAVLTLDDESKTNLDHLCVLQEISPLVLAAARALAAISSSTFYKAVVRAAKGTMPKGKSEALFLTALIGIATVILRCNMDSMNGVGVAITNSVTVGAVASLVIGVFLSVREGAVKLLLASYRQRIVPVAQICSGEDSERLAIEWLEHPAEAQGYLNNVEGLRMRFEDTYLDLN